jgi:hypothetical protein
MSEEKDFATQLKEKADKKNNIKMMIGAMIEKVVTNCEWEANMGKYTNWYPYSLLNIHPSENETIDLVVTGLKAKGLNCKKSLDRFEISWEK